MLKTPEAWAQSSVEWAQQKERKFWQRSPQPMERLTMEVQALEKSRRVMMKMIQAGEREITRDLASHIREDTYRSMVDHERAQE